MTQIGNLRETVDNFLAKYSGLTVYHLPNPGNAGDSLLATGTFQAFSRHNIRFEVISLDAEVDGKIVILGGGGNFVPLYHETQMAFERFLGRAKKIILLPHTIRGNEDLLRRLDYSCTLFCRDETSYEHVRANNPAVEVVLAHDMAFHVDVPMLIADRELARRGNEILEKALAEANLSEQRIRSRSSIDFLRLGIESQWKQPKTDLDISVVFRFGVLPGIAPLAAWCFLKAITFAVHINTDRLHVGIAAALVGTPCTLYDNSYGKNAAVYNYSLCRFSSVRFSGRCAKRQSINQTEYGI